MVQPNLEPSTMQNFELNRFKLNIFWTSFYSQSPFSSSCTSQTLQSGDEMLSWLQTWRISILTPEDTEIVALLELKGLDLEKVESKAMHPRASNQKHPSRSCTQSSTINEQKSQKMVVKIFTFARLSPASSWYQIVRSAWKRLVQWPFTCSPDYRLGTVNNPLLSCHWRHCQTSSVLEGLNLHHGLCLCPQNDAVK